MAESTTATTEDIPAILTFGRRTEMIPIFPIICFSAYVFNPVFFVFYLRYGII